MLDNCFLFDSDIPPEPPKVITPEPSSSTTADPNQFHFVTSNSPSTASSTTVHSTTTAKTTTTTEKEDYPEPGPDPTSGPVDTGFDPDDLFTEDPFPETTPPSDDPPRSQPNILPFFGRPGILAGTLCSPKLCLITKLMIHFVYCSYYWRNCGGPSLCHNSGHVHRLPNAKER